MYARLTRPAICAASAAMLLCGMTSAAEQNAPDSGAKAVAEVRSSRPAPDVKEDPAEPHQKKAPEPLTEKTPDADLVAALGDENWQRREAAFKLLEQRCAEPIGALGKGLRSTDDEISTRCGKLLAKIGAPAREVVEPLTTTLTERRLRDRARSIFIEIRGYSWMGVQIRDVKTEELGDMGLRSSRGALVTRVINGTPAQGAGLKENDFIVAFNEEEVEDIAGLILVVGSTSLKRGSSVQVIREGSRKSLPIKLKAKPPIDPGTGMPKVMPVEVKRER